MHGWVQAVHLRGAQMKVYSCDGCDPNNGPCLLTVKDDDEAPDLCPYDEKAGARWVLRVDE